MLKEIALSQDPPLLQYFTDDTGDGGLTGTGVTHEAHMDTGTAQTGILQRHFDLEHDLLYPGLDLSHANIFIQLVQSALLFHIIGLAEFADLRHFDDRIVNAVSRIVQLLHEDHFPDHFIDGIDTVETSVAFFLHDPGPQNIPSIVHNGKTALFQFVLRALHQLLGVKRHHRNFPHRQHIRERLLDADKHIVFHKRYAECHNILIGVFVDILQKLPEFRLMEHGHICADIDGQYLTAVFDAFNGCAGIGNCVFQFAGQGNFHHIHFTCIAQQLMVAQKLAEQFQICRKAFAVIDGKQITLAGKGIQNIMLDDKRRYANALLRQFLEFLATDQHPDLFHRVGQHFRFIVQIHNIIVKKRIQIQSRVCALGLYPNACAHVRFRIALAHILHDLFPEHIL